MLITGATVKGDGTRCVLSVGAGHSGVLDFQRRDVGKWEAEAAVNAVPGNLDSKQESEMIFLTLIMVKRY